jgi:hypothetical protein
MNFPAKFSSSRHGTFSGSHASKPNRRKVYLPVALRSAVVALESVQE